MTKADLTSEVAMLLPIEIRSINQISVLQPGEYSVKCSVFVQQDGDASVMLLEYMHQSGSQVCAIDALYIGADGGVRMSDFLLLPDGMWRDNFGAKSESLGLLMPQEITSFAFVEELDMPSVLVESTNVR
ncbi:hypothetical protein [Pandoraea aquatica]|nr:hypothetical protein [Pandoraea aquatica]